MVSEVRGTYCKGILLFGVKVGGLLFSEAPFYTPHGPCKTQGPTLSESFKGGKGPC